MTADTTDTESGCRLQGGATAVQYANPSRIVGAIKEGTRSAVEL